VGTFSKGGAGSFASVALQTVAAGNSTITVNTNSTLIVGGTLNLGSGAAVNLSGGAGTAGLLANAGRVTVGGAGALLDVLTGTSNVGVISMGVGSTGSFTTIDGAGTFVVDNASNVTFTHLRQTVLDISGESQVFSRPGMGTAGVSRVSSMDFSDIATVQGIERWDLADSALVYDYVDGLRSPLGDVRDWIVRGYVGGDWQGNGLTSSLAAADHHKALGYAEAAQLGIGSFLGQTVDNSTVLVRLTLSGDANLDGKVDLTDFTFLASNFNGTGRIWPHGDFNYDGKVDLTDFTLLTSNFNQSLAAPGADAAAIGAVVPEPTPALTLATGICFANVKTRGRRRR
jgi:hypothetical protein